MYVVTNNSRLVDAQVNPVLSVKDVQDEITLEIGSQRYAVYTTSDTSGYRKHRDMFTFNLVGQVPMSVTDQAAQVMKATWIKKTNSKCVLGPSCSKHR